MTPQCTNGLRETQIREKTSSITGAGPKRAVAHHMKTLNILEDMSGVWTDITEDTHDKNEEAKANGQGEVSMVREDNMEDVEEAMLKQQEIFLKIKEHITYELGMQTLGGKNKFGFKLVKHREDDPDFDKDLLNFDESDVRAWEKSYVQRERESLFLNLVVHVLEAEMHLWVRLKPYPSCKIGMYGNLVTFR